MSNKWFVCSLLGLFIACSGGDNAATEEAPKSEPSTEEAPKR